jgi:hypothetical protein
VGFVALASVVLRYVVAHTRGPLPVPLHEPGLPDIKASERETVFRVLQAASAWEEGHFDGAINELLSAFGAASLAHKRECAELIAREQRLRRQYDDPRARVDEWERRGNLAMRSGDPALAADCQARQREYGALATKLLAQYERQKVATSAAKARVLKQTEIVHRIEYAKTDISQALHANDLVELRDIGATIFSAARSFLQLR